MRAKLFRRRIVNAFTALILMVSVLCFVLSSESFAEDGSSALRERHVWFTYGWTDCSGRVYPCTEDYIGYFEGFSSAYPTDYAVIMMLCDSGHTLHVKGDGMSGGDAAITVADPRVLDIDSEGNVTPKKTGKTEIRVTVPADDTYKECSVTLLVTVDRHDGWVGEYPVYYAGRSPAWGLDLDIMDEPQQLVVPLREGATASFSSNNTGSVYVDADGWVTPVAPGTADIRIDVSDAAGKYKPGYFIQTIRVTGTDTRKEQQITGDLGGFTIDWHDGLALDLHAETSLTYTILSGTKIASVDSNGFVSFSDKGRVCVRVDAIPSDEYQTAYAEIWIEARDYAEEEAAALAAEEEAARKVEEEAARKAEKEAAKKAALKAEIAKAKSLKGPALTAKALSGRKIKLKWKKVENADGYIVYVRYPGEKKYIRAVTKGATVKSVTHKGLSKNRVYRYKVRAFKKVKGKVYYGPFSKVRKARVI